jgi:hypothetical protein
MPVLCLGTGQSPKKYSLMCIPSLTAAALLPTSRWGGWVEVGGWGESRQMGLKSVHGKNAADYLLIVGLTDL